MQVKVHRVRVLSEQSLEVEVILNEAAMRASPTRSSHMSIWGKLSGLRNQQDQGSKTVSMLVEQEKLVWPEQIEMRYRVVKVGKGHMM